MSTNLSPGSVAAEYTAVIKQDASWWIGWIEEVPGVNCQERTREKLVEKPRGSAVRGQRSGPREAAPLR